MSTRYAKLSGSLSQERYMSSSEFSELRGISGVAVSARAAVLIQPAKRELLWFIQGFSLAEGGLRRVARELVEMFPERLGTRIMHEEKIKPEKIYPAEFVADIERGLGLRDRFTAKAVRHKSGLALLHLCREIALRGGNHIEGEDHRSNKSKLPSIEEFLVDLCINPRIHFSEPGERVDFSSIESGMAIEENPELTRGDFKTAGLVYFRDIVGALFEFKARHEIKVTEKFQLTAIGKRVWETLDYARARRGMVVVDGLEGRGKTEAAKAWCTLHLGQARFVSLKGITSKTTAFREIAKAIGIASSYARTAPEMQSRIEDVLKRSRLLLVLDEAHFLFNQSRRMYSRPELIDWVDTALVNCGVGCALITTPQFIVCMTRAADQVEWNYRQFRRRVKRWVKLPSTNTENDIKAVSRCLFKKAPGPALDKIVGYALLSKRDLSAVGDVADEVRAMLGTEDLDGATPEHIHRAIYDFLLPSDKTFLEDMQAARNVGRKSNRKVTPPLSEVPEPQSPQEEISPARGRSGVDSPVTINRSRALEVVGV